MEMPDREKIRPSLVRALKVAEEKLRQEERIWDLMSRSPVLRYKVEDAKAELALAGTVLALADMAWETLDARARAGAPH